MVEEEALASEGSGTEVVQTLTEPVMQTIESDQASIEATVGSALQGGTESTGAAENTATDVCDEEREKTLEFAQELTEKGSAFLKDQDFSEAVDCFSRSLEIRVAHYGELDTECVNAYYRYGSALLEKAQAEADMSMKEGDVQQESSNEDTVKNNANDASDVPSNPETQEGSGGKDQGEDGEDCYDDDLFYADTDSDSESDDSDLNTAWKVLDIARAITDKHSTDTMEKVNILCALAEVSMAREDIDASLSDYKKALSILERLVESDSRHIAEINFRICLCLESLYQPMDAIPYCQKTILICKTQMERLANEIKGASVSAASSTVSVIDVDIQESASVPDIDTSDSDKEAEIGVLSGLVEDLEKKLEDLKQQADNHPKKILADHLRLALTITNAGDKTVPATPEISPSRMGTTNTNFKKDLESPTVSTAHTGAAAAAGGGASSGVDGRGVKRVLMDVNSVESSPSKKPATEFSDKADGKENSILNVKKI